MADSNMLNPDLAATHRLMLINRKPLRERFTSDRDYCEDLLPGPITKTKPSLSAISDGARFNDPELLATVNGPSTRASVKHLSGVMSVIAGWAGDLIPFWSAIQAVRRIAESDALQRAGDRAKPLPRLSLLCGF